MRRIFDQCEPTLRRQFRKRERLAGMSRIGDVDDRPSARADRFTGPLAGQPRGVGGAHVGEHRGGPCAHDRRRGGGEGERRQDHLVARLEIEQREAELQRRRPGGDRDRRPRTDEVGKRPLELGHARPLR